MLVILFFDFYPFNYKHEHFKRYIFIVTSKTHLKFLPRKAATTLEGNERRELKRSKFIFHPYEMI